MWIIVFELAVLLLLFTIYVNRDDHGFHTVFEMCLAKHYAFNIFKRKQTENINAYCCLKPYITPINHFRSLNIGTPKSIFIFLLTFSIVVHIKVFYLLIVFQFSWIWNVVLTKQRPAKLNVDSIQSVLAGISFRSDWAFSFYFRKLTIVIVAMRCMKKIQKKKKLWFHFHLNCCKRRLKPTISSFECKKKNNSIFKKWAKSKKIKCTMTQPLSWIVCRRSSQVNHE